MEKNEGLNTDDLVRVVEYSSKLLYEEKYIEAIELFYPYAIKGVTEAEAMIGLAYMIDGTSPDFQKAEDFLIAAANKGNSVAAHNLGTLYCVNGGGGGVGTILVS